jgi:hypothetical protein
VLARFPALFALLFVSSLIGRSEAFGPHPGSVAVYFQSVHSNSDIAFNSLKKELTSLLNGATYKVQWGDSRKPMVSGGSLVVVEFRGSCLPSSPGTSSLEKSPGSALASSQVVDERILPFISLDCRALNDLLEVPLAALPAAQREVAYGRAMARLLAHELYHFLTQTNHHSKSGIAKAAVSATDLLSGHFDFDGEAFARLQASLLPSRQHTAAMDNSAAKRGDRGL